MNDDNAMGATPHDTGTTFRVWAPFAHKVSVIGDFNNWAEDADSLTFEGDGMWAVDVGSACEGQEYRFVLDSAIGRLSRIDPYAREVTSSVGNGIIRSGAFAWDDTPYRTPTWDELIIYELHVGTFNDQPGGGPGSFASVVSRLPYLRDLGVTAIELMPSMEFALDFSWGYNPAHIFAVEQAYGGAKALKQLIDAAHGCGLAVIFDVVYNHLGPSDLDMWQFDGFSENGKGGIYFYEDRCSQTPWGDTRPDYRRAEVRRFMLDNARQWLEEFRFDGLRWDATAYIRNIYGGADPDNDIPDGWRLMQLITGDTDVRQSWKLHIAEDLRDDDWITRPSHDGGAGFDVQWDAGFVHPIRRALIAASDGSRNMADVRDAIVHTYSRGPLARVIYTESHDEVANGHSRLPEEIWPGNAGSWYSRKRSTLGAVLVMTAPGIPMLFQGQEILEDRWFRDDDPIDWTREQTYAGILRLYVDLIALRRNRHYVSGGLRGGNVTVHHLNDDGNVIAYHRWASGGVGDDVVVLLNIGNRGYDEYWIGFPRSGTWRSRCNTDARRYGDDYGDHGVGIDPVAEPVPRDGMRCSASVPIGPYSAIILSQDP
jgi:1,4-alpha-glucan branching enzyme